MKLKTIFMFTMGSVAILAGTASYAGGPDAGVAPCPVCIAPFTPFVYLGGGGGWAYSDWNSFIFNGAGGTSEFPIDGSIDTNGGVYGGKIGYQISENFGVEGGGYVLPDSDQTVLGLDGTVQSWFAYAAGTIRASLFNPFFHIFGKVGGVYRAVNHSGALYADVGDGGYWTVLMGAGMDYDFSGYNVPLAFGLEYLLVPGSSGSWLDPDNTSTGIDKNAAPAAHVGVATLSLHFAV